MAPDALALRVLLVEDEPMNAQLAAEVLRDLLNCQVTLADDGLQALHEAAQGVFDLILMDVRLPAMDGLETTRRIARIERSLGRRHTPVVAVTGSVMPQEVQQCFEAGVDAVLAKPYRIADFEGVVLRWGRSQP
jgi:two-component system sensor histidine kinase/response regulator